MGALEPGARLLGGLYRLLCWLGVPELCWEGVGVRLPLGLNRLPWPCAWPGACWGWGWGLGELSWGGRGGRGGSGGGAQCSGSPDSDSV